MARTRSTLQKCKVKRLDVVGIIFQFHVPKLTWKLKLIQFYQNMNGNLNSFSSTKI